jgi:hypothetical protein
MTDEKRVEIFVSGGTVACNPPRLTLKPRQSIQWLSPSSIIVDFGEHTPFQRSQFRNNDVATVRGDAVAGPYNPTITVDSATVSKTVGGVDVQH